MDKKEKLDLKEQLAENKFLDVFKTLRNIFEKQNELFNNLIVLEGKFNKLNSDANNQIISDQDKNLDLNKIRFGLLNVIDKIEIVENKIQKNKNKISIEDAKEWICDNLEEKNFKSEYGWDLNSNGQGNYIYDGIHYSDFTFENAVLNFTTYKQLAFLKKEGPFSEIELEKPFEELIHIGIDFNEISKVQKHNFIIDGNYILNRLEYSIPRSFITGLHHSNSKILYPNFEIKIENYFAITLSFGNENIPTKKWKFPVQLDYKQSIYEMSPFTLMEFTFIFDDEKLCDRMLKAFSFLIDHFNPQKEEVF